MTLDELLRFDDIVVQCHNFPDADTVASGFAVYWYLKRNGKNPRLIYSGAKEITKPNLHLMTSALNIPLEYVTEPFAPPQLLVTVDCVHGESNVRDFDAENYAVIDHHLIRRTLPFLNEVRGNYGSCSTVVTEMLRAENIDINCDTNLATALYYGLYTDTGALSEISHPADRNLRDFAKFDKALITMLSNSILSENEMRIAGDALKGCVYDTELKTAVTYTDPCDPNILGIISDFLLQVDTVESCVVYTPAPQGYKISVRSCIDAVKASELSDYITEGNGGGHALKAGGMVTHEVLGNADIHEFINSRIRTFLSGLPVLKTFEDKLDMTGMKLFRKRKLVLGFVPSTDIAPQGGEMLIRMLEGDARQYADSDIYIMVGVLGEVYPIKKDKFERSYTPCDTLPDIAAECPQTIILGGERRDLSGYVRGCVTKDSSCVRARRIDEYMRVITEWDKDSHLFGAPGDYLVCSTENEHDFYIVKKKIFDRIYEEIPEGGGE
ncbi:MAG: DHH family phosphoesterase [Ruminococcus sp.]|nr:DHH family phosphoesterase [Ruminococcus sp.]